MSRRAPPRDRYDDEEIYEMERERERDYRPRRQDREYENDVEYRRRRSDPPVEDLERLHLRERERPRRDFMEESFAHPREREEMMLRRSREETVISSPERPMRRSREEAYPPPSGSRRRHHPRETGEEDLRFEEHERRRGSRRHPREVEEDLIMEERERHGDRSHRPEREVEEDLFDEEEVRHEGRRRSDRVPAEDFVVEERERRGDRRRRPKPEFEEENVLVERERRRGSRRHPREIDEGLIIEERERRRERRPAPDPEFEEDIRFEERERRRPSRRHPERRSEDDLLYETEKRRSRRRPERRSEDDLIEGREIRRSSRRHPERKFEEDMIIEEQRRHDEDKIRREIEEDEVVIRRRGKEPPMRRGWDSEQDLRPHDRRFEMERDQVQIRSRPRPPPPHAVEVEEVILDERPADQPGGPMNRQEREFEDDDVLIRWKGKGRRPPIAGEDEELVLRERRERRSSPPVEELERKLRGLRKAGRRDDLVDEEMTTRSTFDSRSRPRDIEADVELDEEIRIRKTKEKLPSRPPSPSMESIHVPPIHQDVFTHHRHIDHGFENEHLPHAPSPRLREKGSFDEIDIHHRKKQGGRMSEEDIVIKHRNSEESLSPTSHPSVDFHDPWEHATSASHRAEPIDDGIASLATARSFSRSRQAASSIHDLEDEIEIDSTETEIRAPKGLDGWSAVQALTREEAIEMTGALDVVEVKPRRSSVEEAESGRVAQQIMEPKSARDDRWTEITKKLVVREAIEDMGYEYEESRGYYYIFSYLKPEDIDELVDLSDAIRSARRRRITEIQRERSSVAQPMPRMRPPHMGHPRMGMPPQARMMEKPASQPFICLLPVYNPFSSSSFVPVLNHSKMSNTEPDDFFGRLSPSSDDGLDLRRSTTVIRVNDERFNIPSHQRKLLLSKLKEVLKGAKVTVPFWACVQVCDLSKLEFTAHMANLSPSMMETLTDLVASLPYKWTQRLSPYDEFETESTTSFDDPKYATAPLAKDIARERDGYKCVITGAGKVYQTARIFPVLVTKSPGVVAPAFPSIWKYVDFFWDHDTAERWKKAVFNSSFDPERPVNDCTNLICLRNDLRTAWVDGLFALRPVSVSDDKTEMEIEFHWQPRVGHATSDMVDVTKEPPPSKDISSVENLLVVVPDQENKNSFHPIQSGHRFKIKTHNPVDHPLPSFDLLDMQWNFTRIVSMSAVADTFDDGDDDDDDDGRTTVQHDYNYDYCNSPKESGDRLIGDWLRSAGSKKLNSDEDDSLPDSDFYYDDTSDTMSMTGPLPGKFGLPLPGKRSTIQGPVNYVEDVPEEIARMSAFPRFEPRQRTVSMTSVGSEFSFADMSMALDNGEDKKDEKGEKVEKGDGEEAI
ncbi:uncharacterized protein N7511_000292 [Penicillium nucicola]|uniref:uncharacterized protein n=1 Tax=Penicillium nucicola TaxID=1850975 RepID=UPI0025457A7A|nr:uncharacterized protein N7511_000292 [Penicillium nucicola]KAJ5775281.1 hypothetical protein N7511_000292 [Penicillium nucicola]